MRRFLLASLFVAISLDTSAQKVTGLSDWDVFLDPGHSQNENVGVFGYSEAHKNLEVGLALRDLLLETTDIDTVWMSRTNHFVQVSLSQRVDFANQLGAAHFHSIHSNAGGPSANSVLILWPQYLNGLEAVPNGGKRMSEIMNDILSDAMRIPSVGAIGECDFYGYASCRATNLGSGKGGSRNFVQSFTNMASELSEAGFHTNPTQNQRNMNADWKRLEAQAMFWTILEYHGIERPPVGILSGIVRDVENNKPINGAVITVGDTSYVTDTYESLFNQYSNDPDALSNGFYYLDGLEPGAMVTITFEAPDYQPIDTTVTLVDSFFTFVDVTLISEVPPTVASSSPEIDEESFRHIDPIRIDFTRQMDQASVEAAFSITPQVDGVFSWLAAGTRMIFRPDTLLPESPYTVRIEDTAVGRYGHGFDGDGDGEAGGAFVLEFTTSPQDVYAPLLVGGFPQPRGRNVPLRPVITYTFDELLAEETVTADRFELRASGGGQVTGDFRHDVVRGRSVISFFPHEELEADASYIFVIEPGLADIYGNAIEAERQFPFSTTAQKYEYTLLEPFEPSSTSVWWEPQQSGSTTGIITDSTAIAIDPGKAVLSNGSTQSHMLSYGWDLNASSPLIRTYVAGGPAQTTHFDTNKLLQVYIFGDGSGNGFRFAVDEPGGGAGDHEVSPWFTIDWYGWRLVEWNLSEGETGTWLGDGVLTGPLNMDSFQFTHLEGGSEFGRIWLDDLRIAQPVDDTPTEHDPDVPTEFALHPNYPNPFNPSTTIRFSLPEPAAVSLVIYNAIGQEVDVLLEQERLSAATHEIVWDASMLPSGLYIARLSTAKHQTTRKLILAK